MAGLDGMQLLFGGESQDPIPTQTPTQPPQKLDGMQLLMGAATQAPSPQSRSFAQPKLSGVDFNAEPDAPDWWGWARQKVVGKQDPRYKHLPVFSEMPEASELDMAVKINKAKLSNAGDVAYGDILQKELGPRFLGRTQDANGYDIIRWRGGDGRELQAYVNKPGLDWQDIDRSISGAMPYVASSTLMGRLTGGAPMAIQMATQGGAAGATNLATQVAQQGMGRQAAVSPGEVAVMTGVGAAGPPIAAGASYLWRRFVTEPSLFDRVTGQLTERGLEAARKAGVDPDAITQKWAQEFAKTYAMDRNAARAATRASASAEGVPVSIGQLTKDKEQLAFEEAMRRGIYGYKDKGCMDSFDKEQGQALASAVENVQSRMSQSTVPTGAAPTPPRTTLSSGQDIRGGAQKAFGVAKAGERQAWEPLKTNKLEATPQAFAEMPTIMQGRLGGLAVDESNHPFAYRMGQMLDEFMSGAAPKQGSKALGGAAPSRDVDSMRRALGELVGDAKAKGSPSDITRAGAIYDGFNDWIGETAKKALLKGDPAAAGQLVAARGVTRELKEIFEPRAGGKLTPGGRALRDILDDTRIDSAEGVVTRLFGPTPGGGVKPGTVEALGALKTAYQKYLPGDEGKMAWDSIRATYAMRLFKSKKGEGAWEIDTAQNMLTNVENAIANQRSVLNTLYSPVEFKELYSIRNALRTITYKDPNPSGTAYTAAGFAKQFLQTVMRAFGGETVVGRMAVQALSPVYNLYGAAQAGRATSQAIPRGRPPSLMSAGGIGAAASSRETR